MGIIYKHTSPSGKCYIGQSINTLEERLRSHVSNSKHNNDTKNKFLLAIQKYGIENFESEVLETVDNSKLNDREEYYINLFDSYYNGYNGTLGGDSSGHELNEKVKESMSKGTKKYWDEMSNKKREQHKANCSESTTKEWANMSEEKYKQKCKAISESLKGKPQPEWKKQKQSKRMSGASNSTAKHIIIYNKKNEVMFECKGNFKQVCDENKLPHNSLRKSHTNNGERILQTNRSLLMAKKKGWERCEGWYAISQTVEL